MASAFRILTLLAAGAVCLAPVPGRAQPMLRGAEQTPAVFSAHLPSLRGAMAQTEGIGAEHRVRELRQIPLVDGPGQASDPVVQSRPIAASAGVTAVIGFDGIGVGLGSYSPRYAPPEVKLTPKSSGYSLDGVANLQQSTDQAVGGFGCV